VNGTALACLPCSTTSGSSQQAHRFAVNAGGTAVNAGSFAVNRSAGESDALQQAQRAAVNGLSILTMELERNLHSGIFKPEWRAVPQTPGEVLVRVHNAAQLLHSRV